jgi:hypothetical protein
MIPDHGQWLFCASAFKQILSYHEFHMRRVVGVFLILLFWLGPLAAVLPANAESRLPACCRRNGAHHCALSAASHPYSGGSPVFADRSQCPSFPDSAAASTVSVHAMAASPARLPAPLARSYGLVAELAGALLSQPRSRAGRGPPASTID